MPAKSVAARSLIPRTSAETWGVDVDSGSTEEVIILKDGKLAWIVCAAGFLLQVLIVGMLHVFGVFFVQFIQEFRKTKGEIAWIGSAAYGLSMAFGPVTGMLVHRYGNRPVTVAGCCICALSAFVSSFASGVEMLFLTYSLLYGIGVSLAYTPTMTIAQDYFDKYVSIATGIMTAGSSTGTLILAPLTQYLVDAYGWRVAFRFFAGTCVFTVLCAMMFKPLPKKECHPREMARKSPLRRLVHELKLWKDRVFIVWVSGITCVMFGYYIPYVHLVSYAKDVGVPPDQGSVLVMLLGGATAVGRVMFGKIVQFGFLNRLHLHQMSMVITGTGAMLLPLITSFGGLVAYVIVVGLVDGCFVVLLPLMTATLVGSERTVVAWGFLVGAGSITFTLGPPVAGWMYDFTGSYKLAFHVAGIPIVLGALILFLIPWAQRTSKRSNGLETIGIAPPADEQEERGHQSPIPSPISSPMCGTHSTATQLRNDSSCFSNSSIHSTKNVSLTLTSILDSGYQKLRNATPNDENAASTSRTLLTSHTHAASSGLTSAPLVAASLPANLHMSLGSHRIKPGLQTRGSAQEAQPTASTASSVNIQKELFQKQKKLMLASGRVRAKSWSESGQKYRDSVQVPQVAKSERHRDFISSEARSQLTVDNADKMPALGRRPGTWNYGRAYSSDLTLDGAESSVSSDANYQGDVSHQGSEESVVNMSDIFGMPQFRVSLTQSQVLGQSSDSLQLPTGALSSDTPASASPTASPPGCQPDLISLTDLPQPDNPSSSSSSDVTKTAGNVGTPSPTRSSTDKLPTITEHKPFQLNDSLDLSDRASDAVSDLAQIALLSSGGEG